MIRRIKNWLPIRVLAAYGQSQASNYASALAFTCMLAMFPLMLGVLALIGYAIRDPGLEAKAEALIIEAFPSTAQPQLLDAIHGVRQSAGWLGLLSLAGLLWSASSIFGTMEFALTQIFGTKQRDMVRQKLMGLVMMVLLVVAVGMTEPGAGSAVTDLATRATRDAKGWRINGSKIFTTHSAYADLILAYVRFGPGVSGIGSVLIETRAKGVKQGRRSQFMSGEEWAELNFEDVLVPEDMVLLGEGGFKKQIAGFNVERIGNAARSAALGRYAFEAARAWALERKQFGRLLCEFQGLQWKFADMKLKLDAAQLLLYRAAANADRGLPSPEDTAIAKAYCNQAGFDVANESLQVMGGMGYSQEALVEYCLRRCRGWMIAGGSIEILKNRIAESVFERSFPQRPGD